MTMRLRRPIPPSPSCLLPFAFALIGCVAQAPVEAYTPAAAADAAAPAACKFGAFVQEDDPAGLNVRDAPGAQGRILGTLPPTLHAAGEFKLDVRVEVEVVGAKDGWLRVAHAQDNEALTGSPARATYPGEGWVSGRKLTVKSQATRGYAAPGATAPVVMRFTDDESFDGDEMVAAGRLLACKGTWAQVEFSESALSAATRKRLSLQPEARAGVPPGRFRAWLNQICAVQETTCDGLEADD